MKMQADLFSSEGFSPLTEQMALLRQENMNIEQYIEIAGHSAMDLGVKPEDIMDGFMLVSRDHISGVFKYPAEEGVLPSDRLQASEILDETFQTVAKAPFLAQVFDPVELFKESVRQKGLRNIDDFLQRGIKAQTAFMTPDQLAELYAKGDIQKMGAGGANMAGRPDQGITAEREELGVPAASSAETVMNFTVEDVEFPGWHYQRLVNTQDVHTGIWNSYSIIATTNLRYIAYTISGVWRQYIVVIP
jgi:hypothetical protein